VIAVIVVVITIDAVMVGLVDVLIVSTGVMIVGSDLTLSLRCGLRYALLNLNQRGCYDGKTLMSVIVRHD
jgi:hypothetical protein